MILTPAILIRAARRSRAPALASLGLVAFLFAGCRSPANPEPTSASPRPAVAADIPVENIFRPDALPAEVRRVVVLPVHYPAFQEGIHEYIDELWAQAIQRQNRFETILLDRKTVSDWSGQSQWSSVEPIPRRLRDRIQSSYAPDAILLCDLTRLESYQPLEIGLRAKLFRWERGAFLWGVDGIWTQHATGQVEVHPASLREIFNFSRKNHENSLDLASISPRYFYYHLVESVALTLPMRTQP